MQRRRSSSTEELLEGREYGGFINQFTSWRWTFYTLMIWSGILLVCFIFIVPETYHPVLLREKAVCLRKETGNAKLRAPIENLNHSILETVLVSLIRPFQLLYYEHMVLNLCLLSGVSALLMGILYLFFGAFGVVFEGAHHFQLWQVGLTFLGIFVGMVAVVALDPLFSRNYDRLVQQRQAGGGEPGGSEPEFRLPPAILGSVLVPIRLFFFRWTSYRSVHWIVPIDRSTMRSGHCFMYVTDRFVLNTQRMRVSNNLLLCPATYA
ncbi:hypothetical protein V1504DRAFT_453319 [Lipomyces starkeyi]